MARNKVSVQLNDVMVTVPYRRQRFTSFHKCEVGFEDQIQRLVFTSRKSDYLFQAVVCCYVKETLVDTVWVLASLNL